MAGDKFNPILGVILLFPTWALYSEDGNLAHPLSCISCHVSATQYQVDMVCNLCENWLDFMSHGGHELPLIIST